MTRAAADRTQVRYKGGDLTGLRFGRLTVIDRCGSRSNNPLWNCKCDCGETKQVVSSCLARGKTQSCGCLAKMVQPSNLIHGMSSSKEYFVWQAIKKRCLTKRHPAYRNYGGRGISISKEWVESFAAFIAHVGPRPNPSDTIDRIDNDGNYEPGNVRWVSRSENNSNRRNTIFVIVDGQKVPLSMAVKINGKPYNVVKNRLDRGWHVDMALTSPVKERRRG